MSKPIKIGTLNLDNTVDITDPCYNKDVWCRMTVDCVPGEYTGYIKKKKTDWGTRVSEICIFKDDEIIPIDAMEEIGNIGVDAGMAGFFNNKPDFDDNQWSELCDAVAKGDAWNLYNGLFSNSGFGDGGYDVYANEDRSAFAIIFI